MSLVNSWRKKVINGIKQMTFEVVIRSDATKLRADMILKF